MKSRLNNCGVFTDYEAVRVYEGNGGICDVLVAECEDGWRYGLDVSSAMEGFGFAPMESAPAYTTREEAVRNGCLALEKHGGIVERIGAMDAVRKKAHIREFTLFDFIRQ